MSKKVPQVSQKKLHLERRQAMFSMLAKNVKLVAKPTNLVVYSRGLASACWRTREVKRREEASHILALTDGCWMAAGWQLDGCWMASGWLLEGYWMDINKLDCLHCLTTKQPRPG